MLRSIPMLRFRIANSADIGAIVDLVRRGSRGDASKRGWTSEADLVEGIRTDADQVRAMMSAHGEIILGEDAGSLLACCHCQCSAREGQIDLLTVDPEQQSIGLGSQTLCLAEEWLRGRKAEVARILVLNRLPALGFWYERRGYIRTGATIPFSVVDPRFGRSKVQNLGFHVRVKELQAS